MVQDNKEIISEEDEVLENSYEVESRPSPRTDQGHTLLNYDTNSNEAERTQTQVEVFVDRNSSFDMTSGLHQQISPTRCTQ